MVKKTVIIALIGVIGSLIVIISLLSVNVRPYLNVSQVAANPSLYDNQEIQVIGIVQGYSGGNFSLNEDIYSIDIDVQYITPPSGIQNGTQVVVTGVFHSSLIKITVSQILTQCS